MQVGKPSVPLRLNFDPLSTTAVPQPAGKQLRRTLLNNMNPAAFQEQARRFAAATTNNIHLNSRSGFYHELGDRLSTLASSLAIPSLFQTVTHTITPAVSGAPNGRATAITSGAALNLGTASVVAPPPPPAGVTVDPTKLLANQPFASKIQAGTIDLSLKTSTGIQTTSVSVDPSKDSLNDVLNRLNGITLGGATVSASFNTATSQFSLSVNGSGPDFSLKDANGGNLLAALTNGGQTENLSVLGASVANTAGTYNNLQISYGTNTPFTIAAPSLKTGGRNASAVQQLVNTLNGNSQFKADGLVAAVSGSQIKITTATGGVPVNLQLTETGITTTTTTGRGKTATTTTTTTPGLSWGLDTTAAKTSFTLQGTAALQAPGGAPAPAPQLLGPQASLNSLASQLALSANNGEYDVSINGQRLSFTGNQSLNDVIDGINQANLGVTASYDASSQRVVLQNQQTGAQDIQAQDISGNLFNQLRLTSALAQTVQGAGQAQPAQTTTSQELNGDAIAALKNIGNQLNDALGLLQSGTGNQAAFKNDNLLKDVRDALSGLFKNGDGQSLSDIGFSLQDGQVKFDEARFREQATQNPDQIAGVVSNVLANKLAPILAAGSQALGDEQAQAPLEKRLAQQVVSTRAEISRLQQKQQELLFHQANFEKQRDSLKQQGDALKDTHDRLQGKQPEKKHSLDRQEAQAPRPIQPRTAPSPLQPSTQPGTSQVPGVLSFGLSG